MPTFRPDALVFFRTKVEVSTRAFNFIATHSHHWVSLEATLCHRNLRFGCQLTVPSLHFDVAIQHLGIPFSPSLLRHSPAGVLWTWMAYFSRSSSGRLARSITEVSFQLPKHAPPPQTSTATGFGMHPSVPSAWFPVFAWSR